MAWREACFGRPPGTGFASKGAENAAMTLRNEIDIAYRMERFGDKMAKIIPVIMWGGSGTRVWPESRESRPKQFISLIGARSTFQAIVELLGDSEIFAEPVIITNVDYRFLAAEQLE